jgi:hypothetical protein
MLRKNQVVDANAVIAVGYRINRRGISRQVGQK